MNTINNLIIKDLLALKAYKKIIITVFIMAFIFTFLGFIDSEMANVTYAGIALPISVLGGLANSILYEEEKANADSYILTFPVTRKDIVLSKYLYNIVLIIIGLIVVLFISVLCKIFFPLNILKVISVVTIFSSVTNLMFILKTPFVYKYGTEKANNILMIFLFAVLSIVPVILLTIKSFDPNFENLVGILSDFIPYVPIFSITLIVILNIISYKKSYKIYYKKEF